MKDWIVSQGAIQQKMRESFRKSFPDLKVYQIGEDAEGARVMAEMTPDDQSAYDAREDRHHESVANRVEQYELNLERIRVICEQQGDLQEVADLIIHGMPPQVKRPISLS